MFSDEKKKRELYRNIQGELWKMRHTWIPVLHILIPVLGILVFLYYYSFAAWSDDIRIYTGTVHRVSSDHKRNLLDVRGDGGKGAFPDISWSGGEPEESASCKMDRVVRYGICGNSSGGPWICRRISGAVREGGAVGGTVLGPGVRALDGRCGLVPASPVFEP